MRRVVVAIVVLIVIATLMLGTAERKEPRADFRFISRTSINTLDPAEMSFFQDIQACQTLWEGLTQLDAKTFEPISGTALWPPQYSSDGRRVVFTIRPEARWSNGDPVTAGDYVRGWRRAIEPGTADVYAELISNHITGADEYADWRKAWMNTLSVVRRLQKGSPIKAETLAKSLRSEAGTPLARLLPMPIPAPPPAELDEFWDRAADALAGVQQDWKALGDRLLDEHIAEMERRFDRVGMRVIDDHHLEVRLARPTPYLGDLTSFSTFMPIHASIELLRERYEDRPLGETGVWSYDPQWTKPDYHRSGYPGLVTNGPYVLKAWRFKRSLRFEANPYYWDRANVRSRTIESLDIDYQNSAFMLYDQGLVDAMMDLSMNYTPDLVRLARQGKRDDIHPMASFGTFYLGFNCRARLNDGRPNPLSDARVRRAMTRAVNRQELVDNVVRRGNPISTTFVPPGQIPGYRSPKGLTYEPDLARRELADAGYPNGQGLPAIEFLYNTGFDHEPLVQAVARMWERELGLKVQLLGKETKTFADDRTEHRFMVSRSGWFGDYMYPTTFLDLQHSKNRQNSEGFDDPHYDGLLKRASEMNDPAERLRILSEAERYLVEEQAPVLPLYTYVTVFAWRPGVNGIYPNPRNQFPMQLIHVDRPARRTQ